MGRLAGRMSYMDVHALFIGRGSSLTLGGPCQLVPSLGIVV